MKKLIALLSIFTAANLGAAAFQPGNLVVYRVGATGGLLSANGEPIFLDEYQITAAGGIPSATLVQSLPVPTSLSGSNQPCIASGTGTTEGLMTRSGNGQYLIFTCYGRTVGGVGSLSGTLGSAVPRVIARVAADGSFDTSTALSDLASLAAAGAAPRSAVSDDGTRFWAVGGSNGVRFAPLGATTSTQVSSTLTNLRQINIVEGNLLATHASGTTLGRVVQIGTGLPTGTGEVATALPGTPITGSAYGFFLVDLDATVPGNDTMYVADDGVGTAGILKYSLVAGSWVLNSTSTALLPFGTLTQPRALSGGFVPGQGVVFATVANNASVVAGIDSAGYNVAASMQMLSVITAGANTAIRGLARAPEAAVPVWTSFANGFE
jgi:hypothetical protein